MPAIQMKAQSTLRTTTVDVKKGILMTFPYRKRTKAKEGGCTKLFCCLISLTDKVGIRVFYSILSEKGGEGIIQ